MFDTVYSQIGAAFTLGVTAFVFLKGDEPERVGAGAFVLAFLATLLIHDESNLHGPQWGLVAVDLVLLGVFAAVTWKSGRSWPVWAVGCQGLVVMTHVLMLVDLRPPAFAFYAIANLASYGVMLALGLGAFGAWRDRRAAGLE